MGTALCITVFSLIILSCSSSSNAPPPLETDTGIIDPVEERIKYKTLFSGGGDHTCLSVRGALSCWGKGGSGRLGNGDVYDKYIPTAVTGMDSGVTDVAAGYDYTCAVKDGVAKCWGEGYGGRLGTNLDPNDSAVADLAVPKNVGFSSGSVKDISAGRATSCAIKTDESVWCWGSNSRGQLGDGSTEDKYSPVQVFLGDEIPFENAKAISSGEYYNCAIAGEDALVYCWGGNEAGQLGTDNTDDSLTPVKVIRDDDEDLDDAYSISSGDHHTCVLSGSGDAWCWGWNGSGQLARGNNDSSLKAHKVSVPDSTPATGLGFIRAKGDTTCTILSGIARCAGENRFGQLGIGNTNDSNTLINVQLLTSGVTNMAVGAAHACGIQNYVDGEIYCWGNSSSGQVGYSGHVARQLYPVKVYNTNGNISKNVTYVDTGKAHSCAILNGGAYCWGQNEFGEIGNGTQVQAPKPVAVSDLSSGVTEISAGGYASTWVNNAHTCAIKDDNVWCWGYNNLGQLGNGSRTNSFVPVQATTSGIATYIGTGFEISCVLVDSTPKCWGNNYDNRLGTGAPSYVKTVPTNVVYGSSKESISDAKYLSVGTDAACTILGAKVINGTTYNDIIACWGLGHWNALSNADRGHQSYALASITNSGGDADIVDDIYLHGYSAVSLGYQHGCAINKVYAENTATTYENVAVCWGLNDNGQAGTRREGTGFVNPRVVRFTSGGIPVANVISISAQYRQSCAVVDTGRAVCWGNSSTGGLGNNSFGGDVFFPQDLFPFNADNSIGFSRISAGNHGCGIAGINSDKLYCWGKGDVGQLGYGRTGDIPTPIRVLIGIDE